VAESTFKEVDVILWLIEPTTYIGAGEQHIIELLRRVHTPVVLVINKVDTIQKEAVLKVIDTYQKEMKYADIVPVSALKGTNKDELIRVIKKYLPEGPMYYDEDTVTDQPMRQIAAELIREKALKCLDDEIPHGIAVLIESMKERPNGIFDIEATIVCERDSHKGIIIGKQGAMLKKIGSAARYEIEALLGTKVNLQLWVKVRKEWRDKDIYLKNYGYRDE
jgi:GTP-binding protein Era